jgi:hypothetical protein
MVSKVFLFGKDHWLYCSDVELKNDIYFGEVVNGLWHLVYDTRNGILESYRAASEKRLGWQPVTTQLAELTWMCYPQGKGYNEVIEIAKQRYEAGEEANYSLEPIKKTRKDYNETYDEVAF